MKTSRRFNSAVNEWTSNLLWLMIAGSQVTTLWSRDCCPEPEFAIREESTTSIPRTPAWDASEHHFSQVERVWIGAEIWANPMEDWRLENGVAVNTHSGGNRNLTLLTRQLSQRRAPFSVSARFSPQSTVSGQDSAFVGFELGRSGQFGDYRDSAVYGTGFCVGVDRQGHLFIGGLQSEPAQFDPRQGEFELVVRGEPSGPASFDLTMELTPWVGDEPQTPVRFKNAGVHESWLEGLVGIVVSNEARNRTIVREPRPQSIPAMAQRRGGQWRFGVSDLRTAGDKFDKHEERRWGPVLWTHHSLQNGRLIMTAQFAPIEAGSQAKLTIDDRWTAESSIDPRSRVATFIVDNYDAVENHAYQIEWNGANFQSELRAEPVNEESLVIAALSCNDSTGFPHTTLVQNVADHSPDLIAFLGDQLYEPIGGYGLVLGSDNQSYDDRAALSYLRKYMMHGWSWGKLLSQIPSVTLPDDHDVFHGNLWGNGGKLADRSLDSGMKAQDSGGYKLSKDNVNVVHHTQTGHLPPPTDGPTMENGISVYFTSWKYAGIDMAILADRQFKSAPQALFPDAQIVNGWPQNQAFQQPWIKDPSVFDADQAQLLGERQERFLAAWAQSAADESAADESAADESAADESGADESGADESELVPTRWRVAFSQSPLYSAHTLPEDAMSDSIVPRLPVLQPGEYPPNDVVKLDFDGNGWPQSRRRFVVEQLTKAHAIHVAGDQHLGMTGQHGVQGHDDGAWWIATPAIANLWPRRWFPMTSEFKNDPQLPKNIGRFQDSMGNPMTVHAVSNPVFTGREPSRLFDRAVGYSIVRLHRSNGHITFENWPYTSGPKTTAPDNRPYPGWPITIDPQTHRRVDSAGSPTAD